MKLINKRLLVVSKLLGPIWWTLGLLINFNKSKIFKSFPVQSILILDFHLIGDIVLLLPLLTAIRNHYPNAMITLVAGHWAKDIVDEKLVNEIIIFSPPWVVKKPFFRGLLDCGRLISQLRNRCWDLGIEVRGDVRQILMLALSGAIRRVGFSFTGGKQLLTDIVPDDGTYVHLANHHRRIAEYLQLWPTGEPYLPKLNLTVSEFNKASKIKKYVGFHFGASLPIRRLPDEEALKLLEFWSKKEKPIVLFIPPGEEDRIKLLISKLSVEAHSKINLWSGNLRELIVMLSRAERLYLMDSGPAHIAAALGVRSTVIFGANLSKLVRPLGGNVEVVEKSNVSCRPCNQKFCQHHQSLYCMSGLLVDEESIDGKIYFKNF